MVRSMPKLALFLVLLAPPGMQAAMECQIQKGMEQEAAVFGSVDFEFWYAVGLTGSSSILDDIRMFELEQLIFTSIDEGHLWCSVTNTRSVEGEEEADIPDPITSVEDETQSGVGGLRQRALQDTENQVGPVLFTPGRTDEITDYECPQGLIDQAEQCLVVKGFMRILAHDVDRVESAIWGIRQGIRQSMESSIWVGQQEAEGIEFLVYLGDTEEDAFRGGGAGGGFAFITDNNEDDDDNGGGFWFFMIPLLLLLLFLIAGLFTVKNKSRRRLAAMKEPAPERALVGTGDHPDSYHRGSYHYTPEGQQYLSTRCETCLTTRREFFYYVDCAEKAGLQGHLGHGVFLANHLALDSPKDDFMGTIMEDEPYNSLPVKANMHGLAQRHWGNNVHNCGSALCQRCAERKGSPIFIKAKTRKPIDPEAAEQLDSIWIDPNLRTSPEHSEV